MTSIADDVPEEVKRRRNNELLAVQTAICREENLPARRPDGRGPRRGAEQDLGREKDGPGQLTGRTSCDRIVVFEGIRAADRPVRPGRRSREASAVTLFGEVATIETVGIGA